MATASNAWPPPVLIIPSYLNSLTPKTAKPKHSIPIKDITYVHSESTVLWDEEEVDNMVIQEDLEFAVIEKFSYGWPELEEIRKIMPLQYKIKAECKIGFLRDRHVLIRLTTMED
uniref:DUF4283 domain-containing protein n=1 Tax=Solanum tuberosum TaxID=4113 RepID=M1DRG6_SOLTU